VRLVEQLRQAEWKPSPKTDGDAECEFLYQPDGWNLDYAHDQRPIPGPLG
jgi:hypothetical protein